MMDYGVYIRAYKHQIIRVLEEGILGKVTPLLREQNMGDVVHIERAAEGYVSYRAELLKEAYVKQYGAVDLDLGRVMQWDLK